MKDDHQTLLGGNGLLDSCPMNLTSDSNFTSGTDGSSPDAVNSPIIKVKSFYSQKPKSDREMACLKYLNISHKIPRRKGEIEGEISKKLIERRKRKRQDKEETSSKIFERTIKKFKKKSENLPEKIIDQRDKERKLNEIDDVYKFREEIELKEDAKLEFCSPLSSSCEEKQDIENNDVHVDASYENLESLSFGDSGNGYHESDSENEDFFLRYSSVEMQSNADAIDDGVHCKNSNQIDVNCNITLTKIDKILLDDDVDGLIEKGDIDSSLCSIMDRSMKAKKESGILMKHSNDIKPVVGSQNKVVIDVPTNFSDDSVGCNQGYVKLNLETSNGKSHSQSKELLSNKDEESFDKTRQILPSHLQGLFKYFKKTQTTGPVNSAVVGDKRRLMSGDKLEPFEQKNVFKRRSPISGKKSNDKRHSGSYSISCDVTIEDLVSNSR